MRLCQFSEYNCIFWQLHIDLVHDFNKLLGLVDTAKQFKMGQSQYLTISADRGNPLYWSQPIFSELKKSFNIYQMWNKQNFECFKF